MEQTENLPIFFYQGQRVKLTCDLTKYNSSLKKGSEGILINEYSSRGDRFAIIRFDSMSIGMDILYDSLKPIFNDNYKRKYQERIDEKARKKKYALETANTITVMMDDDFAVELNYSYKKEGQISTQCKRIRNPVKIAERIKIFEELGKSVEKIKPSRNVTGSRYIGYIRTYRDGNGLTMGFQKEKIEKWAEFHGIKIVDYYEDTRMDRMLPTKEYKFLAGLVRNLQKSDVILIFDSTIILNGEERRLFSDIKNKSGNLYIIRNRLSILDVKFDKEWKTLLNELNE